MKCTLPVLLLLSFASLIAAQSYLIELPTQYASWVNITVTSANTLSLQGHYYADQSNLVARLDSVGVHTINGSSTVFAHSTIVDALSGTGYEIILDDGSFECIQQSYEDPFDVSQLYYEQFVETTYYGTHLADYVTNKSDSEGNVASAWVDRFLQIPVGLLITDGLSSVLAEYDNLLTIVPENIFNLERLPTECLSKSAMSKTRRLATMAAGNPELTAYMKFIDRIFPRFD
jgi:hypothetical protein